MRLNTEAHAQPAVTGVIVEPEESAITSLALIETTPAALIYAPGALTSMVDKIKAEVRAQLATLDVSIPKDRSRIVSLAARVATAKVKLDDMGKTLTEDHRKVIDGVNADRKAMRDDLDAFKVEVRKPVTDLENAEKERVAAHEAALAEIELSGPHLLQNWMGFTVEAMRDRIREIDSDPRDWQEFSTRAAQTKAYAKTQILQAIEAKEQYVAAQVELERLRAEAAERAIKEREEAAARAAKEAAERRAEEQACIAREAAERERQRVENERLEAEARAKQAEAEKIAAEERAARELKEAKERLIREAEEAEARRVAEAEEAVRRAKEAEAKAERDRIVAIEQERQRIAEEQRKELEEAEKRARNRAHQGAIHREILEALALLNVPEESGKLIIAAIAKGAVPHVTIQY
jgi:colicin import membrane protein